MRYLQKHQIIFKDKVPRPTDDFMPMHVFFLWPASRPGC
jgi:hypothetical protein